MDCISFLFGLTFRTDPKNLERGILGLEFFFFTHFLLDFIKFFIDELYDIATLNANKMIVPRPAEGLFIS